MDEIRERITSHADQCRELLPQRYMELQEFLTPLIGQSLSGNMNAHFAITGSDQQLTASQNDVVQLMNRTQLELAYAIAHFGSIETWLKLCIPKEEDGNNFGVAIVLHAIKVVVEAKKELSDQLKELPGYYKERGDAMAKISGKHTSSTTETMKKTEKADKTSEEENNVVVESKKVSEIVLPDLMKAVESIDSVWFLRLCNICSQIMTNYAAVIDYLSKNEDKISSPKGSGGGMSMF